MTRPRGAILPANSPSEKKQADQSSYARLLTILTHKQAEQDEELSKKAIEKYKRHHEPDYFDQRRINLTAQKNLKCELKYAEIRFYCKKAQEKAAKRAAKAEAKKARLKP